MGISLFFRESRVRSLLHGQKYEYLPYQCFLPYICYNNKMNDGSGNRRIDGGDG